MKNIMLASLLLIIFGVSCTQQTPQSKETKARNLEHILEIESPLIQEHYTLYTVREMKKPIAKHSYIIARNDESEIEIRNAEDFAQIISEITSSEDALELARLLTSQEIRPFLADMYYGEVHQKIPTKEGEAEDVWFAIDAEQYEAWNLHEPLVTEESEGYKIERFVACYPQIQENVRTPAQLVKIWEWVTPQGRYSAEIQDVIAEGPPIQKILIFSK